MTNDQRARLKQAAKDHLSPPVMMFVSPSYVLELIEEIERLEALAKDCGLEDPLP